MHDEMTPGEAVARLVDNHRQANSLKAKLGLCGALRSGIIAWRCEEWRETLIAENSASFDAAGGWTAEEPKFGWPADFWASSFAATVEQCRWDANHFVLHDYVSQATARYEVAKWIGSNGGGCADRIREARGVKLLARDVEDNLCQAGALVAFAACPALPAAPRAFAGHYRTVLIRLIAEALQYPDDFQANLLSRIRDGFATYAIVLDQADLYRFEREIRLAIEGLNPAEPPSAN